ncbi:MAG TPA: response regulator [Candidatus Dormibacteraeota bacterium]|nr:response regulator [Candidatus Dormibacteraeota bacterium]
MSDRAGQILIAEDDPINADLLQDLLESQGWTVEQAEDGGVALDKMRSTYYDLLLLDLHMPNVDGVEVLRTLRLDEITRPGRVVVVTADLLYGIREDLASLGADVLLSKPVDITALLDLARESMPAEAGKAG